MDRPIHHFDQIHAKADDFLQSTIGKENHLFFKERGYLEVKGTNNGLYRITKDGEISKTIIRCGFKEFVRKRKKGLALLFAIYLGIMTFIFTDLTEGLHFYSMITVILMLAVLALCLTTVSLYEDNKRYDITINKCWRGAVDKWNFPIEDGIAICYMNIKFDSNRFDRDKGCGIIHIYDIFET